MFVCFFLALYSLLIFKSFSRVASFIYCKNISSFFLGLYSFFIFKSNYSELFKLETQVSESHIS
jgi:hypothetical protein